VRTRQAKKLGFQLEEFHLAARGMTGRRLSGILEARGIPGFILSPLISRSRGHVSMQWEKFSSVVIGLGYRAAATAPRASSSLPGHDDGAADAEEAGAQAHRLLLRQHDQ
jgi:LacI family transcriptional regulator